MAKSKNKHYGLITYKLEVGWKMRRRDDDRCCYCPVRDKEEVEVAHCLFFL